MNTAPAGESFSELLVGLVRGDPNEFLHLLKEYETPFALDGTRTVVRTHFLAVDAGGRPAVDLLASSMARAAMDFCIRRAQIRQSQLPLGCLSDMKARGLPSSAKTLDGKVLVKDALPGQ